MSSSIETSSSNHASENERSTENNDQNEVTYANRRLSSFTATTVMMRNMTWINPQTGEADLRAMDIRFCPKCVSDVIPKVQRKRPKGAMKKAACLSCSSVCCLGLPWLCGVCIWPFVCPGFKEPVYYCPNCNKRLFD